MTATLMRYLELQEEKKNSEKHSKKLESEMQRLKGILIAEMGSSCTALCDIAIRNFKGKSGIREVENRGKERRI